MHPAQVRERRAPDCAERPGDRADSGAEWKRLDATSVGEFDLVALFDLPAT